MSKSWVFVDCEASGGSCSTGLLTEFGAVHYKSLQTFHGVLVQAEGVIPVVKETVSYKELFRRQIEVFTKFESWIKEVCGKERPIFISDNVAYDWQWINDGFWKTLGYNPFGHSGRRISDFYAGLQRDFGKTQEWKKFRITPHDHNPVHDAMGNVEAFKRILDDI